MKLLFVLNKFGDPTYPWFTLILDGQKLSNPLWGKERKLVLQLIEEFKSVYHSDRTSFENNQDWSRYVIELLRKVPLKSKIINPYPYSKRDNSTFEKVRKIYEGMITTT